MSTVTKREARIRRHRRVRGRVNGSPDVPRMSVFRSNKHMYVQFIDDHAQHTVAAVSTLDPEFRKQYDRLSSDAATALGKLAAERAGACQIRRVVFDRGGAKFHGRIKIVADAAREAGLEF